MLTQLPKTARDVLATAVHDDRGAQLLEIVILRLFEVGEVFAFADELAVPYYGGVIHSRWSYFLLSHEAYSNFPTESDECFVLGTENRQDICVRKGYEARVFHVSLTGAS